MDALKRMWRYILNKKEYPKIILKQVKKDKNIVYGAQSMNKHLIGFFKRPTEDYDIYSDKPRRSAVRLEHGLDKFVGMDLFYTKPAIHKGTWKVQSYYNNIGMADFTRPKQKVEFVTKKGVRFARLSMTEVDKRKSLADPMFAFRHIKDRSDLDRILVHKKVSRMRG